MKAIVLHEYGGPDKLMYEDFPDPVAGPGEVLVRVAASSVNPVDSKMRSGEAKGRFPVEFPGILGWDISGVVRTLGESVHGFEPGDKVMALGMKAYAELATVKAKDLVKVPEGMDVVEAAALPLVTLTGDQLIRLGALKPKDGEQVAGGQTVLVAGAAGSVGRTAVFVAKRMGAVVIAGVRKSQLAEARSLGADEVIALDDEGAVEKLGFMDAVADCVGHQTAEMLLGKVKQGGIFASVLGPPANAKMNPTVRIIPIGVVPDAEELGRLAQDVLAKRLVIPIETMRPLAEAGEAQAEAEKGGKGKILLLA